MNVIHVIVHIIIHRPVHGLVRGSSPCFVLNLYLILWSCINILLYICLTANATVSTHQQFSFKP